jgi:hypothetical protein
MVLLGDKAQEETHFGPFGDSANLDARWCTVCTDHTIGSKIVLDTPIELESHFGPFGDSVCVGAR